MLISVCSVWATQPPVILIWIILILHPSLPAFINNRRTKIFLRCPLTTEDERLLVPSAWISFIKPSCTHNREGKWRIMTSSDIQSKLWKGAVMLIQIQNAIILQLFLLCADQNHHMLWPSPYLHVKTAAADHCYSTHLNSASQWRNTLHVKFQRQCLELLFRSFFEFPLHLLCMLFAAFPLLQSLLKKNKN